MTGRRHRDLRHRRLHNLQELLQRRLRVRRKQTQLRPLQVGSKVIAGTVLGRIGGPTTASPRTSTSRSARPAAAPRGSTRSRSSTAGSCSRRRRSTAPTARTRSPPNLGGGGVLLLSKEALQRRVLADPRLEIYSCGRTDIRQRPDRPPHPGDDRVPGREGLPPDDHLAEVRPQLPDRLRQRLRAHLRQRDRHRDDQRHPGDRPPGAGHPHRRADQVAAAAAGDDGPAPADLARGPAGRTRASPLADHYDHVHVGYCPSTATARSTSSSSQLLKPTQWQRLIDRLGEIDNPRSR